jgi:hypothetical protein
MGPSSQPRNMDAKTAMPVDTMGSVGMSLRTLSARSGYSERKAMEDRVAAIVPRMEVAKEYRRREVRRVKNVFQSKTEDVEDEDGGGEAVVVVEACRTRHREGVKKEEGVDVEGGFAANTDSLERGITRALMDGITAVDERLRVELAVDEVKNGTARAAGLAMGR